MNKSFGVKLFIKSSSNSYFLDKLNELNFLLDCTSMYSAETVEYILCFILKYLKKKKQIQKM